MICTDPSATIARGEFRSRSVVRTLAVAFATLAITAGCSGELSFSIGGKSLDDAAVELIEGELADIIGAGPLDATCPEVAEPDVGTTFSCTATTTDGRTIEFAGLVDREDHIDVGTTNVIIAPGVPDIEAAGVQLFNENVGTALDASAMDCGNVALVLPDDGTFDCILADASTGEIWDVTYTIADPASGDFDLEWALRP